jgi:hypothetical protein
MHRFAAPQAVIDARGSAGFNYKLISEPARASLQKNVLKI